MTQKEVNEMRAKVSLADLITERIEAISRFKWSSTNFVIRPKAVNIHTGNVVESIEPILSDERAGKLYKDVEKLYYEALEEELKEQRQKLADL